MPVDLQDTIAAIASPPGPAKRGIVRISGQAAVAAVAEIFRSTNGEGVLSEIQRPTRLTGHVELTDALNLPAALMVWPTARSYTGQPMVEIHTDSSAPLLNLIMEGLFRRQVRAANRGEFTLRAFLAGRIDLVQAEAVVGVIDAADHEELSHALSQLGGGVTSELGTVRNHILQLLGDLEAGLDFVEEDIEFITVEQITGRLTECLAIVERLQQSSHQRLRDSVRPRVVLAGLPNAGKSTLFNRLVPNAEAIVSDIAGTTRDYLIGPLDDDDLHVDIVDTAGQEAVDNPITFAAQTFASQQAVQSNLVVWCSAADLNESERTRDEEFRSEMVQKTSARVLNVLTRADLVADGSDGDFLRVSGHTGDGLSDLRNAIVQHFETDSSARSDLLASTAIRCRDSLSRTQQALAYGRDAAEQKLGDEVVALELRDALHQLGVILGEVYTDDILDHIFSNFCIGK